MVKKTGDRGLVGMVRDPEESVHTLPRGTRGGKRLGSCPKLEWSCLVLQRKRKTWCSSSKALTMGFVYYAERMMRLGGPCAWDLLLEGKGGGWFGSPIGRQEGTAVPTVSQKNWQTKEEDYRRGMKEDLCRCKEEMVDTCRGAWSDDLQGSEPRGCIFKRLWSPGIDSKE